MRKLILLPLAAICLMASCKKSGTTTTPTGSSSFTLKVNGVAHTFSLYSATLQRSTSTNQKRMDITGISEDSSYRVTFTIGEETSSGNGITTGSHTVRMFNDDDPATPADESIDTDAMVTLSRKVGADWITDVYKENGTFTITGNDISGTTISGTLSDTLVSMGGGTNYTLSEGSFSNIKYMVLN